MTHNKTHNNMKNVIVLAALFLAVSILPVGAQEINDPFASAPVYAPTPPKSAVGSKGPSYVAPPGAVSANANREVVPIGGGYWIVIGLAMGYGFICRKRRE